MSTDFSTILIAVVNFIEDAEASDNNVCVYVVECVLIFFHICKRPQHLRLILHSKGPFYMGPTIDSGK